MAENMDSGPPSPPLPKKGQYNIDFDNLDESSINPFASSKGLSSSPPIRSNPVIDYANIDDSIDPFKSQSVLGSSSPGTDDPFQSKNKLGMSPPLNGLTEEENPFQSKSKVGNSPPGSPKTMSQSDISTEDGSHTGTHQSAESESSLPGDQIEKKALSPKKKKIVKKSNVKSKLKLPSKLKQPKNGSDEIQLFMPGGNDSSTTKDTPPEATRLDLDPYSQDTVEDMDKAGGGATDRKEPCEGKGQDDVPYDAAPEAMASSSEMDQQFLDRGEDAGEPDREEFVATNEALAEPSELDLMDKDGADHEKRPPTKPKENTSLLGSFDPLAEEKSSRKSRPVTEPSQSENRESDLLTGSPVGQPSSEPSHKHPAVRALDSLQADDANKIVEHKKSEASSEEAPFFDALEYPPHNTNKASKTGQKPAKMERASASPDGSDGKGTMVQLVQVLRYSQTDWNKLKQELELGFQTSLLNKERDWSLLLAERDSRISGLEDTNDKLKQTNEDMRMVVAEFEKTISQLQADKEKNRTDSSKSLQTVEHERDQALEDLASVENAFSDLHRRYEKSKTIIEGFKRNEEQLKHCVEDLQSKLKKSEAKMQMIKSQAEEQLDKANEDIDKLKKSTRQDIIRLEASVKKSDLRISSLEESLQRKEKENQELTAICDELIAKVGT